MDAIAKLIWAGVSTAIVSLYNEFYSTVSGIMVSTMGMGIALVSVPFVSNTILLCQEIAGVLLTLKIMFDSWYTYILHSNGEPSDAGGLLKRAILAAFVVVASPWMAKSIYLWGTSVSMAIADTQAVDATQISVFSLLGNNPGVVLALGAIIALVIWALILIQTAIRAVDLAFLSCAGAIMSVGLTSPDQGVFQVWWRELITLSLSQATQIFFVKGALVMLAIPQVSSGLSLLFCIAFLWVAYKSPNTLRQFAYSTGMGGAVGGAVQQGGSILIMRKMLTRGA